MAFRLLFKHSSCRPCRSWLSGTMEHHGPNLSSLSHACSTIVQHSYRYSSLKKKDIFCQPFLLFFFFFFIFSFPSLKCTKKCICFAASLYSMLLASSKMVICSPMETYRFLFFFVAKLAHNMSSFFIRRPASHWVDKEVAVIYVCFFGRGCYS